jgi:AcrR family transcriptional regulator
MKVILDKYFETISKLFLEIGIKSITMDDVCYELGISKKTLYKEYTDKSELVTEVFLKDFHNFKTKLISAQKNCPNAIAETCILFKLIAEKQNSLSLSTLYDLRKYYNCLFNEITGLMNRLTLETFSGAIERGVQENNFRNDIVPCKVAAFVVFIFGSILMQPLYINMDKIISLSNSDIIDYHFKSICTQEGLVLWEQSKNRFNFSRQIK